MDNLERLHTVRPFDRPCGSGTERSERVSIPRDSARKSRLKNPRAKRGARAEEDVLIDAGVSQGKRKLRPMNFLTPDDRR
jgi:hypothetical protein